ncbi:MAG: hypothetical protein KGZ61_06465 [Sandarakinorhabdus sp.]|nr:hypothetical protein [Sandarakinorhabdus sp.]
MKIPGTLLAAIGLAVLAYAFTIDTSVAMPLAGLGITPGDSLSVTNFGLLQRQMMLSQLGLAAALGGILLFAAGAVIEAIAIRPTEGPEVASAAPSIALPEAAVERPKIPNRDLAIVLSLFVPLGGGLSFILHRLAS